MPVRQRGILTSADTGRIWSCCLIQKASSLSQVTATSAIIVNLAINELGYGLLIPKELFVIEGGGYLLGEAKHIPISPNEIHLNVFVAHHHEQGSMLSKSKLPLVKAGWS